MPDRDRSITVRRNAEQIVHCAAEALSVIEHDEDLRCAVDDLRQARQLIDIVLKEIE